MRLIDADELLTQVRQIDFLKTPNSTKLSACEIMKIINGQPTVYNADAVVEELKRLKTETEQDIYERAYAEGRDKGYSCGNFCGYTKAIDDFVEKVKEIYPFTILELEELDKVAEQLKEGGVE